MIEYSYLSNGKNHKIVIETDNNDLFLDIRTLLTDARAEELLTLKKRIEQELKKMQEEQK